MATANPDRLIFHPAARSPIAIVALLLAMVSVSVMAISQLERAAPSPEAMPTINQSTAVGEAVDNSRECDRPAVDSACIYL